MRPSPVAQATASVANSNTGPRGVGWNTEWGSASSRSPRSASVENGDDEQWSPMAATDRNEGERGE